MSNDSGMLGQQTSILLDIQNLLRRLVDLMEWQERQRRAAAEDGET